MPDTAETPSAARENRRRGAATGEDAEGGDGATYRRIGPKAWILGGLMVAIGAVTAWLIWTGGGIKQSRSYLYLAFYAIPANTAISVFPHEPVVIYFGEFANIWITGAAALAGTLAAGYMDHSVFVPVLNLEGKQGYKENDLYRKGAAWFSKYPFATLVVAGATPVPFWPFKVLSFSLHYPLWRYMAALTIGRFPRYVVLAWIGMAFPVPKWILVALFLGILLTYAVKVAPDLLERVRIRLREADGSVPRRPSAGDAASTDHQSSGVRAAGDAESRESQSAEVSG